MSPESELRSMRRAPLSFALAVCGIAAISACSDPPFGPPKQLTQLPRPLTGAEQTVSTSGNNFTFTLFKQVSSAQPGANVFISPLSASMALGMAMNGATGSTYDAMRTTLGFDQSELTQINAGYKGLIALLRGLDRTSEFSIVNSVWYRKEFAVNPTFVTTAQEYFSAEVAGIDFANAASLTTINNWVRTATGNRIPTILDRIQPEDVMFLINAIYFKGSWRSQFNSAHTRDDLFHLEDGSTQPMRLMNQNSALRLAHRQTYAAADLPYGNGAFAMTVILPHPGVDVDQVVNELTAESWAALANQFHEGRAQLGLPKLKLEYERTLNDDLVALGMGIPFDPIAADFSGLGTGGEDLHISFVKQKTFVEINEEGTVAAAATGVGMATTSAPPSFIVNRPFIFAIRERLTGTILFIAKIVRMP